MHCDCTALGAEPSSQVSHVAEPALAYSFGPQRTQALREFEPIWELAVPWGHCSQKEAASMSEYEPAAHSEQLEALSPPGRERNDPGKQNESQNDDPSSSVKLPEGQGMHELLPRTGEYEPGEHNFGGPAPKQKDPSGQGRQSDNDLAPEREYVLIGQACAF